MNVFRSGERGIILGAGDNEGDDKKDPAACCAD